MVPKLSLLEVLTLRSSAGEVDAVLVIDDAASERAYRVHVTYDVVDESVRTCEVRASWTYELVERPIRARDRAQVAEIRRYVECDDDLTDALVRAHREWVDDMRVAL